MSAPSLDEVFVELDAGAQDEIRGYLLEVMAADSAWHGPAGEGA